MADNEKTFDTARSEVEALFAGQEEVAEETPDEVIENTEETDVAGEEESFANAESQVAEEAISTAEQAVSVAQQKNAEAEQLVAQLQAEKERSAALERQLSEMNSQREEEVVEELLTPPVLDIASLAFETPEAQEQAQRKFAEEMAEYNRKMMEKEFAPLRERARKADELEAIESIKAEVASDPRFKGFSEMLPRLQTIVSNNKTLANADIPLGEKLIQAYAIARGVDVMEAPEPVAKEMTTEEFVEKYKGNDDFRKAIEQLRIEELKGNQQVPPLASSAGAGNVALNIKEKPQTFKDASERTRQMFRM